MIKCCYPVAGPGQQERLWNYKVHSNVRLYPIQPSFLTAD